MLNGKGKGIWSHVVAGAGLAIGVVAVLGTLKIISRATGIGSEFTSFVGETQNTLNYDGPGQYDLS